MNNAISGKSGAPSAAKAAQPGVVAVAEAFGALALLEQLDPVEDDRRGRSQSP